MPMDERSRACLVSQFDVEPVASVEAKAGTSIRADEPEDPGRPAVYFERAGSSDEALRQRGSGARPDGQNGQHTGGERDAKKVAAREGLADSYWLASSEP